jgi:hypothetical protein
MAEYNITEEALKLVTVSLAKKMNINLDQQRLDSVHIKSNMKKLSRLGIFVKVISNFIRYLSQKKDLTECYKQINPEVIERYCPVKEDRDCNPYFGQIKPSEHDRRLSEAANDLYSLVKMFDNNSAIIMLKQYKQMFRVLNDQCEFNSNDSTLENGLSTPVSLKVPKDIPSNSLQNPSDEEAGYSGHKGQGYQVQLTETCTIPDEPAEVGQESFEINNDVANKSSKQRPARLITAVKTEGANEHDAKALIPMLEITQENELAPSLLLADTAYGSDENVQKASNIYGVELISPVAGKDPEGQIKLSDFQTDESGKIIACPEKQKVTATKTMKNGNIKVGFKSNNCAACPNRATCPVTIKGSVATLKYSKKQMRLSKRRAYEKTEEYKRRYRMRSGIEATNSTLARVFGIKRLRVRGLKMVDAVVKLKALGLNIMRGVALERQKNAIKKASATL